MKRLLVHATILMTLLTGCGGGMSQPVPAPEPHAAVPAAEPALSPAPAPAEAPPAPAVEPAAKPDPASPAKPAAKPGPAPAAKPAPPSTEHPKRPRLAILVYHDVDDRLSNAYTVTTAQFESQIQMLKEEGYAFYKLADVERLLAGGEGMPEKAVLLAFDDGYSSFYTHVMPVARKYGVPATCFVVTKYLDQIVIETRPHMSVREMRELAADPLADLAGHSHDGHREVKAADGNRKPVLTHPVMLPAGDRVESRDEYQARVAEDFELNVRFLRLFGVTTGTRHFTFPFTARSREAVQLGEHAGFRYFYVGGEQLVTPDTDRTAIPRVHAGAPEITAEVLRERLRTLFAQ